MVAPSERRSALFFAGVFGAVATTVWAVLQAFPLAYQLEPLGTALMILNVGGGVLWWQILGAIYDPSRTNTPSAWVWLLTTHFVAAFVQGVAYAFFWSVWRRSRSRAAFYVLATALATFVSFIAGIAFFHKVNCSAADFDGECDLGIFEGMMWAAVAFGVMAVAFLVVETRIRRASRTESTHP